MQMTGNTVLVTGGGTRNWPRLGRIIAPVR